MVSAHGNCFKSLHDMSWKKIPYSISESWFLAMASLHKNGNGSNYRYRSYVVDSLLMWCIVWSGSLINHSWNMEKSLLNSWYGMFWLGLILKLRYIEVHYYLTSLRFLWKIVSLGQYRHLYCVVRDNCVRQMHSKTKEHSKCLTLFCDKMLNKCPRNEKHEKKSSLIFLLHICLSFGHRFLMKLQEITVFMLSFCIPKKEARDVYNKNMIKWGGHIRVDGKLMTQNRNH